MTTPQTTANTTAGIGSWSISVGSKFPEKFPKEGIIYAMSGGKHFYFINASAITDAEIQCFKSEKLQCGLLVYRDVIFVVVNAGHFKAESPFSWHLLPSNARQHLPELTTPSSRYLLPVCLIDSGTGIVKAMRQVTLSPQFSGALRSAMLAQAARPWIGNAAYDMQISTAYQHWPSPLKMLSACPVKCNGGD
jgi:hypothetical protein